MYKEILRSMAGIDIFGIISLLFFFLIFLGVLYWSIKVDKAYITKMKNLPLDSSNVNGDL